MKRADFRYCALHYLNQWISQDRHLVEAMTHGSRQNKLDALRRFAFLYRVARTLPDKYDLGRGLARFEPVLRVIERQSVERFNGKALIPSIKRVAELISREYHGKSVISPTTKFLWSRFRSPILIYDSQCREALGTPAGDLDTYYVRWHEEFQRNRSEIDRACASLLQVRAYTIDPTVATRAFVQQTVSEQWFKERVFDMYLWSKGRPNA
jgi:hypothetical protein